MSAGCKILDTQNNSLTFEQLEDDCFMTVKETTRRIQSPGWNRAFHGLSSWPKEEEEED
jgi:hypothetical protein